jgi:hypothetical protein
LFFRGKSVTSKKRQIHFLSANMNRTLLFVVLLALIGGAFAGSKSSRITRGHGSNSGDSTGYCQTLIQSRATALNALSTAGTLDAGDYAAAKASIAFYDGLLSASACCANSAVSSYFAAHATPFGSTKVVPSGPVCGYDFNTYSSVAAACPVGVYHAGACNFFLDSHGNVEYVQGSTNLACYSISNVNLRIECVFGLAEALYANTTFFYQPPDYFLASQVQACTTPATFLYRQVDGSCNNLGVQPNGQPLPLINPITFQPYEPPVLPTYSGMVNNKFIHESTAAFTLDPIAYLSSGPNPREISIRLFTRTTQITPPVPVNALTMAWVNWFVHDFMNHDNADWQAPYMFPLPANDPYVQAQTFIDEAAEALTGYAFENNQEYYMVLQSTFPSGDSASTGFPTRRNAATAWFDGSQVYGSDIATQNSLRTFSGGLLQLNPGGPGTGCATSCLPNGPPQQNVVQPFLAGDYRVNFHPGLTAMHTLWVREHNNIATLLAQVYPNTYNDEELFQIARIIVNAEMIKIHTREWSNQMSIDPSDNFVTNTLSEFFITGTPTAFQANYPLITHATPEEFVAAYKWHSYVPTTITLHNSKTGAVIGNVDYVGQFQNTTIIRTYGVEDVLVSLGMNSPGAVRLNNLPPKLQTFTHAYVTPRFINPFAEPTCVIAPIIDMAAMDIIRDRERGIPKYNDFRNLVSLGQLPPAQYFDDISDTPATAAAMADVYQWTISDVDAIVGMHGEKMNSNQAIPVTMLAAFIPFVTSRLLNDRFYNVNYDAEHYTAWGIQRLRTVDFAQVLCDNGITCSIANPSLSFYLPSWTTAGLNGTPTRTKTVA